MKKLLCGVVVALVVALPAAPAGAQIHTGWFYHPNSGNYWYCDYYPGTSHLWGASSTEFWCYTEYGRWIGALSPEKMIHDDGWQPA